MLFKFLSLVISIISLIPLIHGKIINKKIDNFELNIPHQKMNERNFVLYPLKEIYPDWKHPKTKDSIDILIKNLKTPNNEITKLTQNDINNYVK